MMIKFGFALVYVMALVFGFIGWIINLVAVINLFVSHAPIDAMFVGRVVGVPVFIIGAVLGWF